MTHSLRVRAFLFASAIALASCGGTDDGGVTASSTTAADGGTTTTAPSTTGSEPETETTTTATTIEQATGQGQAELMFDDGRSWALNGSCTYTPDNSGPAAALWNVDVAASDGASLVAIMAFPFDATKTTPVLIGNFVDAEENIFVFITSEDVSSGSNLILNLGLHDGIKTADDPIDFTATLTCRL